MGIFNVFTQEIAIDLGTANTLVITNDKVVVDQPLIEDGDIKTDRQGSPKADTSKRDSERVPLSEDIDLPLVTKRIEFQTCEFEE